MEINAVDVSHQSLMCSNDQSLRNKLNDGKWYFSNKNHLITNINHGIATVRDFMLIAQYSMGLMTYNGYFNKSTYHSDIQGIHYVIVRKEPYNELNLFHFLSILTMKPWQRGLIIFGLHIHLAAWCLLLILGWILPSKEQYLFSQRHKWLLTS